MDLNIFISFNSAGIIQLTMHNPCIVDAIGTHVVEKQIIQIKYISPSSDYGTLWEFLKNYLKIINKLFSCISMFISTYKKHMSECVTKCCLD